MVVMHWYLFKSIRIEPIALEATNISFRFMKLKINILRPFSQVTSSCHSIMVLCLPPKQRACFSGYEFPSSLYLQASKDLRAFPQSTRFAAANKWMPCG
jgi:hypothetical protein